MNRKAAPRMTLPGRRQVGMTRTLIGLVLVSFGLSVLGQPDPETERASFRVLDGFEVNLFASEREGVRKPIQIRFDPEGRLWVVGSVVYPQIKPGEDPDDEVVVLEDTDGDGRADRSTVFARGLHIPTGLELGDGGVYVGAATELLHLRDTNGDGRADQRRVVFRGFGTGDTHQTINSFCWGPQGELMMSQGLHADSRVETPWGIEELKQAGVWRLWPRPLRLDAFWSGAMGAHNPFGTVFDRWGQPIILAGNGHGIYHLTQAMIRTDRFLEQRWIWNQGRKFGGGDFVENSHWPTANQGEVVSGGYLQNTVERFRLTDDGATFRAERLPPLVESTNTAFRIVDVRFGPDGALYLCDWYNPVIGHYQASFRDPARDKAHGRIWRVTAKGRPLVRWEPLTAKSTADLVNRLGSAERWERQMTRRVLAERSPEEVASALITWLAALPLPAVEHARYEALGLLSELDRRDTDLLTKVAASPVPEARAFAARVAGEWARRWGPGAQPEWWRPLLGRLVSDDHPRVRLEAVVACSYVPDPHAIEVAVQVADRPMDSALEYAFAQCVQALRPWWEPVRQELQFENQPARAAAFAQAEGGAGSAQFAASRLRRVAEVALDPATVRQLTAVVASAGGPADLTSLLLPRSFTVGAHYDAQLHVQRLREAVDSSRQRGVTPGTNAVPLVARLLESPDPQVRAAAWRAAGQWRMESLRPGLETAANNEALSPEERSAAVEGLAGFDDDAARVSLAAWSRPGNPSFLRATAIVLQVPTQPRDAASATARWFAEPVDPEAVAEVVTAFLRQREGLSALTLALRDQPPHPAVGPVILTQLARSGRHDADLSALLAKAGGFERSEPWSAADIPTLMAAVRSGGNAARGAVVFQSPQLACTTCHSVDGTPGKIGPDLGALGTAQSLEFILGALIEPQREVKEGFMAHEVVTQDGTVLQGYLRGESANHLAVLDHLTDQVVQVPRPTIAEQRQLGSLMPAGLVDGLSADDFRDLAAYLVSLGRK